VRFGSPSWVVALVHTPSRSLAGVPEIRTGWKQDCAVPAAFTPTVAWFVGQSPGSEARAAAVLAATTPAPEVLRVQPVPQVMVADVFVPDVMAENAEEPPPAPPPQFQTPFSRRARAPVPDPVQGFPAVQSVQ
jgi:hypothetical protein